MSNPQIDDSLKSQAVPLRSVADEYKREIETKMSVQIASEVGKFKDMALVRCPLLFPSSPLLFPCFPLLFPPSPLLFPSSPLLFQSLTVMQNRDAIASLVRAELLKFEDSSKTSKYVEDLKEKLKALSSEAC